MDRGSAGVRRARRPGGPLGVNRAGRRPVALVDDRRYEGLTPGQALDLIPAEYRHPLLALADSVAVASTELPLLVVDLRGERGRCVRVVAAELWGIENNLSGANMDFEEFAGAVGDDGVFRGF
ncbi:DUF6924 domain-containing protein [Streptomyces sp. NPDC005551]|uniref:DUF6924 domain-containing protein n=1 Tax=Streptomyces sp. NPDC005551 TaxID=3364725 RepID=UPI0036CE7CE4